MTARAFNIVLGVWLFLSAFIWPHTMAQMNNTWICGALTLIFALVGTSIPDARYLNTVLSIYLFISTFAVHSQNAGTVWNNALVSIGIFIVSLVGVPADRTRRRTPMQPV